MTRTTAHRLEEARGRDSRKGYPPKLLPRPPRAAARAVGGRVVNPPRGNHSGVYEQTTHQPAGRRVRGHPVLSTLANVTRIPCSRVPGMPWRNPVVANPAQVVPSWQMCHVKSFTLHPDPLPFDQRVLALIQTIPAGKVATYRQVARLLGTKGYQAVGQALRRNAHPITIPCHRVVRADGRVGGYAGCFDGRKARLLRQEGVRIRDGRINLQVYGWES